ncbi:YutD family protein [Ligilactobacillus equi]|uniref:YutD family protein n=1 Tax=Ligilactobacillus equi TaxID=137357 RepID=UPI002ED6927E
MNDYRRQRREEQLARKAETIKAFASDVIVKSEEEIEIDGHPYILLKNYRDGFQVEKLKERFSQILTKYDYIVGDWGYDQLRLRGFYASDSKKGFPSQSIDRLEEYLMEYCNFGCAYFVLHNLEVQKPEPIPAGLKRKNKIKKSERRRNPRPKNLSVKKRRKNHFWEESAYDGRKKKRQNKKLKAVSVNSERKMNNKGRHFTIRQKEN